MLDLNDGLEKDFSPIHFRRLVESVTIQMCTTLSYSFIDSLS